MSREPTAADSGGHELPVVAPCTPGVLTRTDVDDVTDQRRARTEREYHETVERVERDRAQALRAARIARRVAHDATDAWRADQVRRVNVDPSREGDIVPAVPADPDPCSFARGVR